MFKDNLPEDKSCTHYLLDNSDLPPPRILYISGHDIVLNIGSILAKNVFVLYICKSGVVTLYLVKHSKEDNNKMKDTDEAATAISSKEQPPSGHHQSAEDDHLSYSSQDSENSGIVLVLNKEKDMCTL